MKNFRKSNFRRGFTLLETFIAITILMLSITGPLTLAQKSTKAASLAKDQVVGSFLAQDAIEYMRGIRDGATDWATFLAAISASATSCTGSNPCQYGNTSDAADAIKMCAGGTGSCDRMRVNTNGQYGYVAGWEQSSFVREVRVTDLAPRKEIKIVVTVYNIKLSTTRPVTTTVTYLTSWN